MRRDQLEHAIRTACQITGSNEVIVVGSQSILGTFREDQLPADATMSVLPPCRPTGAAGSSRYRTPTPRCQTASLSTQAGARLIEL